MEQPELETVDRRSLAAIKNLAVLQHLTLEALGAGSRRELIFIVLNSTASLIRFDRSSLWDAGAKPRLLGISGNAGFNARSPTNKAWRTALSALANRDEPAVIDCGRLVPGLAEDASALWLPLKVEGTLHAGLCLERYGPPRWNEDDIRALRPLAGAYGAAFRVFAARRRGVSGFLRKGRAAIALLALAALAAALLLVRLPLRIVAPCEVVASRPLPVSAPIDGVIEEILVRPGQEVEAGAALYVYAAEVALREVEVARRQVEVVRAGLESASAQALKDRAARAEMQLLKNRLAQEEVRLEAAEYRAGRLRVAAPEAGTVVLDDPAAWRGKPVHTGTEVLRLVRPADSRVRIWLPQEDRIAFRPDIPVLVLLHADSGRSRRAGLEYVAGQARQGPDGIYGFMAEALWLDGSGDAALGLKGTAVVYGDEAPLWYWLLRKPVAAVRRFLGV